MTRNDVQLSSSISRLIRPRFKNQAPIVTHGKGVYLYDDTGKDYIDGCSGAVVANLGHGVEAISKAIYEQAKQVSYVFRTQFSNQPAELLARKILEKSPGLDWTFFINSGTEAVEASMRLAWRYWQEKGKPEKRKILSRRKSFHGMTLGSLSVTGSYDRREKYEVVLRKEPFIAEAYCYRCPFQLDPASCELRCANELEEKIRQIGQENVAAFIAEPIVGASGAAFVPPDGYFQRIRQICDDYDVLFIADEVITGFGRTGDWFGIQHWQVKPDMIVCGKGLSAGYTPMSAVLATNRVVEPLEHGSGLGLVGHTYSANPQSAATALAVLHYIEEHNLVERNKRMGSILQSKLKALAKEFDLIGDVRGRGMLWGIELVEDKGSKHIFAQELHVTQQLVDLAFQHGLLVYPGRCDIGDSVLIAPPFVITEEEMDLLVDRLRTSLAELSRLVNTSV